VTTRKALFAIALAAVAASACARPQRTLVRAAANSQVDDADLLNVTSISLNDSQDAIVRVVGPLMTCTGTLIAADRVLTAHHCLVERGARGEFTPKMVSYRDVQIELGGDYLPWGSVGVRAIVAPPCGHAGGRGDVSVLVLERKLVGFTTMTPRLEGVPSRGESVDASGFGRCAASPAGIRRRNRAGGPIESVGSDTFLVNASICPGDSGGPVLARGSNDIVGVVSLSAMDADENTRNLSVMARIDAFRPVFAQARAIADGADPSDLPPLSCD
jgi:hypothetical protein